MTTSVPTIAWNSTVGFVAPSGPAVLTGVQQDYNQAFSVTFNFNLNTPQGQLTSSEAAIVNNTNDLFVYHSQQVDPAYASGRFQDAICRLYFLTRMPAIPTVLQVVCSGLTGITIPVGALIQDNVQNLYSCTQAGEIPAGGNVTLPFAALVPGPIPIPETDNISIYQTITGWDGVTVAATGSTLGSNTESTSAFELRRENSVAGNSFGAIGSIIGAVAAVPGVVDYYGVNNNTNGTVTVGGVAIAAYSIYICVAGGTSTAVAQAIFSKKGAGAPMTGNTTVTVYDNNPLYATPIPYSIIYEIPTDLQILFSVTLVNSAQVPSNATTLVQNALLSAFAGNITNIPKARIGTVLFAINYVSAITALGSWAQVAAITVGSANTSGAVFNAYFSSNTMTVTTVTSGTIAIGQFISDVFGIGLLPVGAQITAGSGTSWTINMPLTIGATFTGNGSGTNLTASVVVGTIEVGAVIAGTGVPSGTTILSQTSGPTGGAGVYVTSLPTTSSGASLTATDTVTAATANQSSVSINANQLPQLASTTILVGVT